MKRTLAYFLLLVIVAAAAFLLVIKKPWGTLRVDETSFAMTDTASIGKIFIADMNGNRLTLERTAQGWMANQKYEVRRDYISKLLSTVKNVSVSYPVAESAQNAVIKAMSTRNKKVEIYGRGGKLLKAYYVGGPSLDELGTYMLMEGAKHAYVTAIPGFQGTLETRYATDESSVRAGSIYKFRTNEMKMVRVTYPSKPDSSFTISILGADSFQLTKHNGEHVTFFNKQRVLEYLDNFKFVNCESFVNDLSKKDSILQGTPYCTISVTDRSDQPHETVIYNMPRTPDSVNQFDQQGNPVPYDSDHYFATINNGGDFVIIQQFHFGRLFKSVTWFTVPGKPIKS
ncbi:MAG: DUF4340 domain-containing protein [Chitinophagales bacterium]|nr:DUF4340 domain-containing protein [Chitinophagales bacterium]